MPVRSLHYAMLQSTQTVVRDLKLDYADGAILRDDQIVIRYLPRHRERIDGLPIICICPAGSEVAESGTTGQDDWGYPIGVVIIANSADDFNANMDDYLFWRASILDAFINQRTITIPHPRQEQIYTISVNPELVVDPNLFNMNYFYSGMLIRPYIRKQRGERIV